MGDGLCYIEQDDEGPLCPNYDHPLHRLAVKIQNAVWEAADREAGGEVSPHHRAVVDAATAACPNYMRLYSVSATPSALGQARTLALNGGHVEGWYWRCPTCEMVIPGMAVRR
jgi:hypothetical protein